MTEQFNGIPGSFAVTFSVNRERVWMPKSTWTVPEARKLRDWLNTVIPPEPEWNGSYCPDGLGKCIGCNNHCVKAVARDTVIPKESERG